MRGGPPPPIVSQRNSPARKATVSLQSGVGMGCELMLSLHWNPPPSRVKSAMVQRPRRKLTGRFSFQGGGESGIRTHEALLTLTRFPSVRLKPLGHLSARTRFYRASSPLILPTSSVVEK